MFETYSIGQTPSLLERYLVAVFTESGLSNLSAMTGRIDFILGLAGHYALSAAVNATFECELSFVGL